MNTRETLILKALKLKEQNYGVGNGRFLDGLMAQDKDLADSLTKNICARVPIELAEEMENLGGLLDLNKREIITLAVYDFLEKARGVIDEFGVFKDGPGAPLGCDIEAVEGE